MACNRDAAARPDCGRHNAIIDARRCGCKCRAPPRVLEARARRQGYGKGRCITGVLASFGSLQCSVRWGEPDGTCACGAIAVHRGGRPRAPWGRGTCGWRRGGLPGPRPGAAVARRREVRAAKDSLNGSEGKAGIRARAAANKGVPHKKYAQSLKSGIANCSKAAGRVVVAPPGGSRGLTPRCAATQPAPRAAAQRRPSGAGFRQRAHAAPAARSDRIAARTHNDLSIGR
ncbi:MAG: hypothetical protein J3K34DRAFT_431707 [Monoraphidium minutum]|nr:MAG: hypothetical protein J3K34DRAFT_431707 [Monoraphidium minutum]